MNKTPDIDSVGTRMLIELATKFSETIADLYNKFLSACDIPQELEVSHMLLLSLRKEKV